MKTSKQQSANFRRSLHAEKAREAYYQAMKVTDDPYDPDGEPEDLSLPAPVPTLGAWWEMEMEVQ